MKQQHQLIDPQLNSRCFEQYESSFITHLKIGNPKELSKAMENVQEFNAMKRERQKMKTYNNGSNNNNNDRFMQQQHMRTIREYQDQIQRLQNQVQHANQIQQSNHLNTTNFSTSQYPMPSPPSSAASSMSQNSVSMPNDATSMLPNIGMPTTSAPVIHNINLLSNNNIAASMGLNTINNMNNLNNMNNMSTVNNININTSTAIPIAPFVATNPTHLLSSTPQLPRATTATQGINYNQYGLNQVGINAANAQTLNTALLLYNVSASNVNVANLNLANNNNVVNPNMNIAMNNNLNLNGNMNINNMAQPPQINQTSFTNNNKPNNNNNNGNFQM